MNRQLRIAGLVLILGLLLGLGYWQPPGWAARLAGNGAGHKLKQLFSPAAARKASGLASGRAAAPVSAAPLATITVTSLGDGAANAANCPGANCRLRDAIAKAAATGDTIDFAVTGTITLNSNVLTITKNLTIQGPGAAQLTISGNNQYRVFEINGGFTVALSGLMIANGGDNFAGGGIANGGTLTVSDCTLTGNRTASNGVYGGGIYNTGTLTVTGSTIFNNTAGSGGGIHNEGTLTLSNSTLYGNTAASDGGGINAQDGVATITNSTLRGNTAGVSGGGVNMYFGSVTLINSTVSGNTADDHGGGIYNHTRELRLTNCTITNNSSGDVSGGIYNTGHTYLRNTIIAGNSAPLGPDTLWVNNSFTSLGYNLIGINSSSPISPTTGDQFGTPFAPINPQLGPLANNGGATQTHALLPGSPAINAGDNCVLTNTCASNNLGFNLTTDQRGAGFNRQAGSAVDIGAFELAVSSNAPTFTSAAALSRQQGSPAGAAVTIGSVSDAQTAAGLLTVTLAGGTATGITVTGITNTNGTITAFISAACTATSGTVRFQVSDGSLTDTGYLQVNVTANHAPTLGSYPDTIIAPGSSTIVTPSAAPADNGSIASLTATATPNFFTGTLTANTATGELTITNANPTGGYIITATVTDNCGATATRSFMLTVNDCGASLSKTAQNFAANGGTGSFTVTIDGACPWTAVSNNPSFITIVSPQGQQAGSGTVSFNVAGHSSTTPRNGTISVAGQTFLVRQGAQLIDVPVGAPFYEEIGKLSAVGITQGCGGGNYCPGSNVTREQMAAFIIRALGDFTPPQPTGQRFDDVLPSSPFYAFIQQMAVRQITLGCGGGNYCPTANVTREQMAAFLIRALHAPGYVPPAPGSQRFADVLSSNPFYAHIEEMAVRAITLGCGGGNYCPTANVTREQMAAFLVRAFGL
jgi:hypothetical protein